MSREKGREEVVKRMAECSRHRRSTFSSELSEHTKGQKKECRLCLLLPQNAREPERL